MEELAFNYGYTLEHIMSLTAREAQWLLYHSRIRQHNDLATMAMYLHGRKIKRVSHKPLIPVAVDEEKQKITDAQAEAAEKLMLEALAKKGYRKRG